MCIRDRHDIHHADSTHGQGDSSDQPKYDLKANRKAVHHRLAFDRIHFRSRFFVLGIEMMTSRDDLTDGRQSFLVQLRRHRLKNDHLRITNILEVAKQTHRDKSVFVVWTLVHRVLDLVAHRTDYFELESPKIYKLSHCRCALKDFFGRVIPQNYHPPVVDEVTFVEVAAIFNVDSAHLPIRQFNTSDIHGDNTSADFKSEVAVNFTAHCLHEGNFIANRFNVFVLVFNFLAGALSSGLKAGLSRPENNDVGPHVHEGVHNAPA